MEANDINEHRNKLIKLSPLIANRHASKVLSCGSPSSLHVTFISAMSSHVTTATTSTFEDSALGTTSSAATCSAASSSLTSAAAASCVAKSLILQDSVLVRD